MSGAAAERSAKAAVRSTVLAARSRRPVQERQRAAELLRDRTLALPEVQAAATVTAYSSLPGEPGTDPLISALRDRDVDVLLPVLQPDKTLLWAPATADPRRVNQFGIPEPPGSTAVDGLIDRATVIICPGVAGDLRGHRLGRGGGSYDRMLRALPPSTLRCLLLYDDEVLATVPVEPHDQPVHVLITPSRTLRLPG